ncbi:hypothetical protein [Candidatus Ichthyocystis hellenicum]|uniref:hypothetical protein n=1 Tax=Candidatus Ichthyocystis hellenicum TaxID=1561003 RepID=UPI000B887991|nr:hypothetical protein [Candidatus Ichthyocystis hellenicum]
MISSPTGGMRDLSYDPSTDGSNKQILDKDEPCVSSCLDILLPEFNSPEEAEKNLVEIMENIDVSYQNVMGLSSKHSASETIMTRDDQESFEASLKDFYDNLLTRDNNKESFIKLWFSRNFTKVENEQKAEFVNSFCSLIKAAENLYTSKLPSEKIYPVIVTEEELQASYIPLLNSLSAYNEVSISIEDEQKIKDNLRIFYFLFFPGTNQKEYKSWIDSNLTGSSEKKMTFIIEEVVDKCKQAKSDIEKKTSPYTDEFSGEKLSRLVAFICEELSNIESNNIDDEISKHILDSIVENGIHNSALFRWDKSSNVPKLKHLQNLSSKHTEQLYKNYYNRIGKNEVTALVYALANSTGEIHHSNGAADFINYIHKMFDLETSTLDTISDRSFSKESRLVLYSHIPSSIRKEMFMILNYQLQITSMLEDLEKKLNLAMTGTDELSATIRDNVNGADKYAKELEGLLCRDIISSFKSKNVGKEDQTSLKITRSTLDKFRILGSFIERNGGFSMENPLFESSKALIGEFTFNFSLLSPMVAHEISTILNKFEHPQAVDARSTAATVTREAVRKISSSLLTSIREKLLPARTNEEKFKQWSSVAMDMEVEMLYIPGGESHLEKLVTLMSKELSGQEFDDVKKILSEISAAEKTLEYMESRCRSLIIKELRTSLNLWKRSFGITDGVMSRLFRRVEKPQSEWQKAICENLNLYHHNGFDYFYQVDGRLPQDVLKIAKNKCLPNVSNGSQHHIEVSGKEYTIPESFWLDINRSVFIVDEKTIVTDDDSRRDISRDEMAHTRTVATISEIVKLNLTEEALESLLALMNQNTAAQLVFAAQPTSAFMFPKESRLTSSPSMSKNTVYSAGVTPEGDVIFTCNISGDIKALQESPKEGSGSKDIDIIPLDPAQFPDRKFPDQSASMKVRINKDGTADMLDLRHVLTDAKPSVIDRLIKARNEFL